jgi:methyl-accepting chemotaxis protein
MALDVIQVQQFLTDVSATHDPEGYQDAESFANDFKKTSKQFRENELSAAQVTELDAIEQAFDEFNQLGKRMAAAYITGGTQAGNVIMEEFDKASLVLAGRMTTFRDAAVDHEKSITSVLAKTAQDAINIMLVMGSVALGVSLLISLYLTRHLGKQLGIDPFYAKGIALEISKGNLERDIELDPNDNSSLLAAMKKMQQQLLARITKDHQERDEFQRIKIALDSISSNVMVVDNGHNIIYLNPSILAMMQHAESDIRKALPKFDSTKLLGLNMDTFHKNPAHQHKLLADLSSPFRSEIVVGGRTFDLVANAINNDKGQRIGSVVEWKDRTSEVAIEQEVAKIVSGAVLGDFNQRINEGDKEGFFLQLAQGVNELMETSSTGLKEVARVLEAIARGDLTETITSNYSGTFGQLKDDSNSTVEKLKGIISQIKEVSEAISTAAKEIAAGNNDLSYRTEEQAASLEETAASMEELTSTVQANSENAKHANRLAVGATDIAGKGVQVVGQVVSTMESINESSRKVVDIISVIDGIAFQTNILALNAAVEAARAGEQGRGFAVVAVEVRNLAQRAAAAAAEIKGLIGDSVEKVEDGTKLVAQAGKTMEEIVSAIRGVTVIMSEISAASMEQTSGIEQVNQAIAQMDDVTQQNAALVEQAAAAAESLEEQTQNLSVTVSQFKLHGN